ncbi:hypothetical protein GOP47_0004982 [Adiantum capillus-veneris]|uniref:Uncharacterized protein n=1 Tax=Adiantum capillus-veneris TaxID=13818 RepID=A0A9D4V5D0_ADICA|nr:hypothetical protein GOP47_0004982 [Adiantum capillus-veneris]
MQKKKGGAVCSQRWAASCIRGWPPERSIGGDGCISEGRQRTAAHAAHQRRRKVHKRGRLPATSGTRRARAEKRNLSEANSGQLIGSATVTRAKPRWLYAFEDHQFCEKDNGPFHKTFRFMDKSGLLRAAHVDRRSLFVLELVLWELLGMKPN